MTDDGAGKLTGNFLPEDPDTADALRLAEVLERVESGRAPDLDPTEDPALSYLLLTAMRVRADLGTVNDERAFQSFHIRSRAVILHSLEPQHAARPINVVPFNRRALIFAPFAAVAAAAAIALTVFAPPLTTGTTTGSGDPAVATNLTARTTNEELDRLAIAIADIQTRSRSGQTVPAPLLRAVSEGTARVANIIEQSPASVSKETVATYIQAAQNGQNVLKSVTVADQDAQGALAAAQRASRDAVVVAGRFLSATPTATPTVAPTATASPTPSATPAATQTVTPTATATPDGTPTPTASPTAKASPPATPTPSASPTATPSDIVR